MPAEYNLTERDYELLSAYIDGELPDSERLALERRLQEEDFLQRELTALQQSVILINHLPTLRAPRDFALDASMVEPRPRLVRKPPPKRRLLRIPSPAMTSAVAAVFVVVFAGVILLAMMGPAVGNIFSNVVSALNADGSSSASSAVAYASTPVTPTEDALAREGAQPPAMVYAQEPTVPSTATGYYDTADDEAAYDGAGVLETAVDFAVEDTDAPGTVGETTEMEYAPVPDTSTGTDESEEVMPQPAAPLDTFAAPSVDDAAPPEPVMPLAAAPTDSTAPTESPDLGGTVLAEETERPESSGDEQAVEVAMGNGRDRGEDNSVPQQGVAGEVHQQDKESYIAAVPTLIVGAAVVTVIVIAILVYRGRNV